MRHLACSVGGLLAACGPASELVRFSPPPGRSGVVLSSATEPALAFDGRDLLLGPLPNEDDLELLMSPLPAAWLGLLPGEPFLPRPGGGPTLAAAGAPLVTHYRARVADGPDGRLVLSLEPGAPAASQGFSLPRCPVFRGEVVPLPDRGRVIALFDHEAEPWVVTSSGALAVLGDEVRPVEVWPTPGELTAAASAPGDRLWLGASDGGLFVREAPGRPRRVGEVSSGCGVVVTLGADARRALALTDRGCLLEIGEGGVSELPERYPGPANQPSPGAVIALGGGEFLVGEARAGARWLWVREEEVSWVPEDFFTDPSPIAAVLHPTLGLLIHTQLPWSVWILDERRTAALEPPAQLETTGWTQALIPFRAGFLALSGLGTVELYQAGLGRCPVQAAFAVPSSATQANPCRLPHFVLARDGVWVGGRCGDEGLLVRLTPTSGD